MTPEVKRWIIALAVLDVVLLVAFAVILVAGGPATSERERTPSTAASSAGEAGSQAQTDGATTQSPSAEPSGAQSPSYGAAPASALDLPQFQLPSGNIYCSLTEDSARCTIADRDYETPPGQECEWRGNVVVLAADGVTLPCPTSQPTTASAQMTVLEYGQAATVGPWVCESNQSGLDCFSLIDGTGFALARASLTSYGPGALAS
ncbi:hypothetical protein [Serinibacter salmoneus]|uniref:Uncharacterized protein n=1 Tax=Serinibacter salmoneus TaxID=556530 RepID=A0A2A9D260_9MICO|nr:hypothetical protein [Serinibacter salmoneus]PFG19940.1 hypothetical protein ATL40_1519 [Serinibacter salmoneus]